MNIKSLEIKPLEIKNKTNYDWDDIIYINDFDANSLEIIKRESRIGANIYYIRYVLDPDYMIIILQNLCILLLIV